MTALGLTSESKTGSGKNYHNEYRLQHVGTNFDVAGDSKISAGGNFESLGSNVRIGGDSTVAAGGVVHIASLVDVTETESSKTTSKKNAWGASSTKTTNSFSHTETLSGGTFAAGGKSEFSGDAGIRAEGAKVAAVGGTRFESTEGAIELLSNRTINTTSTNSKYKDAAIQANSASSRTTELAGNTEISGGVEFGEAKDGIRLQADLGKAQVNGFVDAISNRSDVQVIDNHDKTTSHYQRKMQLTPEASAVVAIVASAATAGAASSLSAAALGTSTATVGMAGASAATVGAASATAGTAATLTMTQAVGQAVIGAGVASASSQFAVSAINNQGNLGAAAKTTFSSSGLQSIGTSMLAAGLSAGIEGALGVGELKAGAMRGEVYTNLAQKSVIRAGVQSGVYGTSIEDGARSAALNFAMGAMQHAAGDIGQAYEMAEGSIGKVAIHAGIGAAYAGVTGGNAAVGAIAGGVGELAASHLVNPEDRNSITKVGTISAIAAFAAGGKASDINSAANIGQGVAEYNNYLHPAIQATLAIESAGVATGVIGEAVIGNAVAKVVDGTKDTAVRAALSDGSPDILKTLTAGTLVVKAILGMDVAGAIPTSNVTPNNGPIVPDLIFTPDLGVRKPDLIFTPIPDGLKLPILPGFAPATTLLGTYTEGFDIHTGLGTSVFYNESTGGSGEVKTTVLRGAANPRIREAIQKGMEKHKEFKAKVLEKDERWNAAPSKIDPATGKMVKPDALTPSGRPLELKPNTESGIKKGAKQLEKYERVYDKKGKVIYYDP